MGTSLKFGKRVQCRESKITGSNVEAFESEKMSHELGRLCLVCKRKF